MPQFSAGDVVGFVPSILEPTAWLVNLPTWGLPGLGYTHVGFVGPDLRLPRRFAFRVLLYEATSLCPYPCLLEQRKIRGVQAHEILFRARKYHGRVYHLPLTEPLRFLERQRLAQFCQLYRGTEYDTLGAFRARDLPVAWLQRRLLIKEDLHLLFCAEHVAAALRGCGRFRTNNASAWNPNSLIRALLRQGIVQRPIRIKPGTRK